MAQNVMNAGSNPNLAIGTISASGTLSSEFDLSSNTLLALHVVGMTGGTLQFQGSPRSDKDPNGSSYAGISNLSGTLYATGAINGPAAFGLDDIRFLAPYRYVKLIASAAPGGTVTATFIIKA